VRIKAAERSEISSPGVQRTLRLTFTGSQKRREGFLADRWALRSPGDGPQCSARPLTAGRASTNTNSADQMSDQSKPETPVRYCHACGKPLPAARRSALFHPPCLRRRQEIERREKWLKAWLRRQHCPHCAASLETLAYSELQLTAKGTCEPSQPMPDNTKILRREGTVAKGGSASYTCRPASDTSPAGIATI
jgi:hypothetical protein